jgi:hypothetical protein
MATIQRNVKTYGTRSFVGEVAAAPSNIAPVLSNEVDADLDTVYAAWNGGVDSVNIKSGAIGPTQLATDAVTRPAISNWAVGTDEIEDRAVTRPKIAQAAISSFELGVNAVSRPAIDSWAVGTDEIEDRVITEAKIALGAVGTAEIAPGAVVPDMRGGNVLAGGLVTTTATSVLTFPGITTRGGSVLGLAVLGGGIIGRPALAGNVQVQWVRDGAVSVFIYLINVSAAVTVPIPMSAFVDVPPAGNHVYELRMWTNASDLGVQINVAPNQGSGFLMVFA